MKVGFVHYASEMLDAWSFVLSYLSFQVFCRCRGIYFYPSNP